MTTLKLTSDWRLSVDEMGNIATVEGSQETAQNVASACRVWAGEDIWNIDRGIPYKNQVFGKPVNLSLLQAYYEREAKRIDGVRYIEVLITDFENRTLKPDIQITRTDGEIINV